MKGKFTSKGHWGSKGSPDKVSSVKWIFINVRKWHDSYFPPSIIHEGFGLDPVFVWATLKPCSRKGF